MTARQTAPAVQQATELLRMTGLMVQQHHQEHEYQREHQRAEAYGEIIRRYRARYEAEYQRAEAYREMAGHLILKLESLKESIAAGRQDER